MESSSKKRKMAIMKLKKLKKGLPRLRVSLRRLKLLGDMPNEILVKIFNYLPNHDVRFGISLACKRFHEICQDESLVLVKDLCINDAPPILAQFLDGPNHYDQYIKHISEKIVLSKHLTSLKITKMNSESVDELVSIALRNCPKLIYLEFPTEIPIKAALDTQQRCRVICKSATDIHLPPPIQVPKPRRFRSVLSSIMEFGKDLHSIKLLVENTEPDPNSKYQYFGMICYIIEGCPKLKTLTLEPLEHGRDLSIERNCLEKLLKSGKELETLRVIKGRFPDLLDEKEVREILPTWNVEMEECKFNGIPVLTVYDSD